MSVLRDRVGTRLEFLGKRRYGEDHAEASKTVVSPHSWALEFVSRFAAGNHLTVCTLEGHRLFCFPALPTVSTGNSAISTMVQIPESQPSAESSCASDTGDEHYLECYFDAEVLCCPGEC